MITISVRLPAIRVAEYYEVVEIKKLLDSVDLKLDKANKIYEKNKAKQPTPEW